MHTRVFDITTAVGSAPKSESCPDLAAVNELPRHEYYSSTPDVTMEALSALSRTIQNVQYIILWYPRFKSV
jgi:hypothetical protein